VAGRQAVRLAAQAEVVGASVDNHRPAQDVGVAGELDDAVLDVDIGQLLGVRINVAQVADMSHIVRRGAVIHAERVEVTLGSLAAVATFMYDSVLSLHQTPNTGTTARS